jgi:hypothetical protein
MTATLVRGRAPERARPGRWAAHRSPEALVFSGATAVALLDVSHTDAIRQAAREYEQRVTRFFDQSLREAQR